MADDYRQTLDFERYLQAMRRKITPDDFDKLLEHYRGHEDVAEHVEALRRMVKREERWNSIWSAATMLGKWLIWVGGALILFRDVLPILLNGFGASP